MWNAHFLCRQIRDYNSYLQGARKAAYTQDPKNKKKKQAGAGEDQVRMGPFKFTYKELEKRTWEREMGEDDSYASRGRHCRL